MSDACVHCGGAIEHTGARKDGMRIIRASWRCSSCGRAGDYAHGVSTDGRPFTARIEREPGAPALRWSWVPAESVPYEERVS